MNSKIDFKKSVGELGYWRSRALRYGCLHEEAELCYQLTSLYLGLEHHINEGSDHELEYINEKQDTVMRIATSMIKDRVIHWDKINNE